ncbi:hypothetical protein [Streptomyces sp. WZ-12]|uniref:hypothetical protein n=1 Tax=Streptomyces sp. WZ-12 TaxID=3030210 RepID=UPI0023812BDE|nr:hypothetical protein [Streptomyces sp. WZ-12]
MVATAVTAPVVLLSAGSASAFVDAEPSAQVRQKPTYAQLQKAVDDAEKAYKDAGAAEKAGREKRDAAWAALDLDSSPLKAAVLEADEAVKGAVAAKAVADKAVTDAKAKLDAAQDEAGKAKAREALSLAETEAGKAAEVKADAEAKSKAARKAWGQARNAADEEYSKDERAAAEALQAKEAADRALGDATKCVRVSGLTVLANGLPSKVVAGTTVEFSFTVANATDRTLDVDPLVFFRLQAKNEDQHFMKVQWSGGSGWQELDQRHIHIEPVKAMKPGARADVKMRMAIEAGAPATDAFALFAGDASDQYNPCVDGPMKRYDFRVLPAGGKPGTVKEAKPGTVEDKDRPVLKPRPEAQGERFARPSAQGEVSVRPASANGAGSLARTGSSSAVPQLALAGGGAVLLGAGAVFVARRHRGTKGTR